MRRVRIWLHSRVKNFVLILGYHRVAHAAFDPFDLCVQPDHFAEHLDVLQRKTQVIGLDTLYQGLLNNNLPKQAVLITFDDAYQDILHAVKPLLSARDLPATTFAVTSALGQEYWWDRLARLVFSPAMLPNNLTIKIGTETFHWTSTGAKEPTHLKRRLSPRHQLIHQIYERLSELPDEQLPVMAELQQWIETVAPVPDATARAMTASELYTLCNDGLVTVGSHTISHPNLTALPKTEQCRELNQSRQTLENILGQPVTALSYPHGINNTETQRLVEESGYQLAFSSQNGIVHQRQNRYALPRFWVPDWEAEQFDRWLARWL